MFTRRLLSECSDSAENFLMSSALCTPISPVELRSIVLVSHQIRTAVICIEARRIEAIFSGEAFVIDLVMTR